MSDITPPLGPFSDTHVCGYGIDPICGAVATWHIIWTPDTENGMACDRHMPAVRGFAYYAVHPHGPACGRPGSRYFHDENVCRWPDDSDGPVLVATVEVEQ